MENERRREIFRFIEENPGLHLRALQRTLNLPLSSLEYHLDYMVRKKVLLREKDERYNRYYVRRLAAEDKRILSALRQKRMRQIVLYTLSRKKAKYSVLQKEFGLPSSTLSLYLKYLVNRGILKRHKIGRENIYTVQDEDSVAKVLISYRSSFVDRLVDRALSAWMETQFRKRKESEEPKG